MLAAKRQVKLKNGRVFDTPLLVPSFSSKGFPQVQGMLDGAAEVITETFLVSAYDIKRELISMPRHVAEFIFLDSGGYESSKDVEFSDLGLLPSTEKAWDVKEFREVVAAWPKEDSVVLVSYDHPKHRVSLDEQISEAIEQFNGLPFLSELLIKPETKEQHYVQINNVVEKVRSLHQFDIIGFTEKELGACPLERMHSIARVRKALEKAGLNNPIHIFGSLDTVSTPLYFLAGADIFDGLTWLRFAYREGHTIYMRDYAVSAFESKLPDKTANGRMLVDNLLYLQGLQSDMTRFLNKRNFAEFRFNREVFERYSKDLAAKLGG